MATELAEERETRRHLMRTDPDPRVRHRAHALLLVADGQTVAAVARLFGTAGHRVRAWRERFPTEGRGGLVDRSRRGRPPKLGEQDLAFLQRALEQRPHAYGLPVTVWSVRDLQALVQRERGIGRCRRSATATGVLGMICITVRTPKRSLPPSGSSIGSKKTPICARTIRS